MLRSTHGETTAGASLSSCGSGSGRLTPLSAPAPASAGGGEGATTVEAGSVSAGIVARGPASATGSVLPGTGRSGVAVIADGSGIVLATTVGSGSRSSTPSNRICSTYRLSPAVCSDCPGFAAGRSLTSNNIASAAPSIVIRASGRTSFRAGAATPTGTVRSSSSGPGSSGWSAGCVISPIRRPYHRCVTARPRLRGGDGDVRTMAVSMVCSEPRRGTVKR